MITVYISFIHTFASPSPTDEISSLYVIDDSSSSFLGKLIVYWNFNRIWNHFRRILEVVTGHCEMDHCVRDSGREGKGINITLFSRQFPSSADLQQVSTSPESPLSARITGYSVSSLLRVKPIWPIFISVNTQCMVKEKSKPHRRAKTTLWLADSWSLLESEPKVLKKNTLS